LRGKGIKEHEISSKVKVKLGEALKAQKGKELSLFFFNLGAKWWLVVNATPRPLYPRGSNAVPIV
jgi:hypothetical protein